MLIAAGLDALAEWELRPIDGQTFPDCCELFITEAHSGTKTIPREKIRPDELNKFRLKYPLYGMYNGQDSKKICLRFGRTSQIPKGIGNSIDEGGLA